MNDVLLEILYAVISLVITVGGAYAVRLIKTKTDWQYKDEIADAVTIAVGYVQQTFVDKAKDMGMFDSENQAKALSMALTISKELLTPEATEYLHKKRTNTQVNTYMTAMIEKAVRNQKRDV